ncbi:hypothetical protein D3C72_1509660 [compost metagenome]
MQAELSNEGAIEMNNLIDYRVETKCGRIFGWITTSMDRLFREMSEKGYEVTFVMEMDEYNRLMAEREAIEAQINEGMKHTA